MLNTQSIEKLKALGLDVDAITAAIKSDVETEITIPDLVPITQAELDIRDSNNKEAGKKLGESETKATLTKEVAKKLGIELKGDRIGDLVNDIQQKINASDDTKLKDLNEQIKLLQADKATLSKEFTTMQKEAKQKAFDADLLSHLPTDVLTEFSPAEKLAVLKTKLVFEEVDGKTVAKKGSEILRDKNTQNPLELKDAISAAFADYKKTPAPQGGRGGKDMPPAPGAAGAKSMSQLKESWQKENPDKNPMSPEFTAHAAKVMKENPDFDAYN